MTSDVIVKYFYLITARVFILNFEPGKIDIYGVEPVLTCARVLISKQEQGHLLE